MEKLLQIYHHAGPKHTDDIRMQNAGRQKIHHIFFFPDHDSVSCIIAALKTGNNICFFCKKIYDASLSLVTPVDSSHYCQHTILSAATPAAHDVSL